MGQQTFVVKLLRGKAHQVWMHAVLDPKHMGDVTLLILFDQSFESGLGQTFLRSFR